MKVINLFGSPGCGKSTQAMGLAYRMKMMGLNVELVTEYAKDLVWQDRLDNMLDQQEYIFAKQNHRLHRLRGKVDYVVTDSPIIFGIVYMSHDAEVLEDLVTLMMSTFRRYENHNFLLTRGIPYKSEGRRQAVDEADAVARDIEKLLADEALPYIPIKVRSGPGCVDMMMDCVTDHILDK